MSDYDENPTKVWIRNNRVNMDHIYYNPNLVSEISLGYYYYTEKCFPFPDKPEFSVSMEESDYEMLEKMTHAKKDFVHKLIYYSNGNLTNSWNPNDNILY